MIPPALLHYPKSQKSKRSCKNMALVRHVFVLLSMLVLSWGLERCEAAGKFSYEVHHVFSDAVRQNLGFDGLVPEEGSLEYFKVLAQRDRLTRGRGLASNNEDDSPLTSANGNLTVAASFLGSLHYANVSVGTPATWFLVALDTSSDLFWLPCNCGVTCIRDLKEAGLPVSIPLNLYSPNASSTSSSIRCSDTRCFESKRCSSPSSVCPYQVSEPTESITTTSTGTLLQDVLHLVTEDADLKPMEANVTLGCGQIQTGLFQNHRAVNGVLGLGMKEYSVPSLLAKAKIAANSFSICFGCVIGVVGRISFGDKGYTDQFETPFVSGYGVNVTGLSIGEKPVAFSMSAQFDTGSSFTHLSEPAYSAFTKAFNSRSFDIRVPSDPDFPFEFCYNMSINATNITFPPIDMTFGGGSVMSIKNPFVSILTKGGGKMYCLTIIKIEDLSPNIIGQDLMAGYRIVFDRERMVLGWKRSNCFEDESLSSAPPAEFGDSSPPPPETESEAPPPPESETPSPPGFEAPSPPTESNPLLRSPPPPPFVFNTMPPIDPRGSSGVANVVPLATQLLLLLPLLAFL